MAIEETKKKIHFTPYAAVKGRSKDTSPAPTASVSKKYGTIQFSKGLITETGMDGKFVRLYYEPTKKIIGWRLREKIDQTEMKVWKLCRPSKNGTWVLGIGKMLGEFSGRLKQDAYLSMPVQKYREVEKFDPHTGEVFYFVELMEPVEDAKKGDITD